MRRPRRTSAVAASFLLFLSLAAGSAAAQTTWNGSVSSNWHNLANWDTVGETDHVPDGTDNVIIPPPGPFVPHQPVISNGSAICNALKIESGATLTMSGGTYRTLEVEDDWTNNGTFNAGSHRVWLTGTGGTTHVAGSQSTTFHDLRIDAPTTNFDRTCFVSGDFEAITGAGSIELNADVFVAGNWTSSASGITFGGSGTLFFTGTGTTYSNNVVLPSVTVSGGTRQMKKCTVGGTLSMTGGAIDLFEGSVVTVLGSLVCYGGSLGGNYPGGAAQVLDVAGDAYVGCAATTGAGAFSSDAYIRCAGDWTATSAFAPTEGTVELDGIGATDLKVWSGAPTIKFKNLVIKNGSRVVSEALAIEASTRRIQGNGSLYVTGDSLSIPAGTLEVQSGGSFYLNEGRALRCGPTASVSAQAGSAWYMIGGYDENPASRTRVESLQFGVGGYAFTLDGLVFARRFLVSGTGPAGLVLGPNATFGNAPNDFRAGFFEAPSAATGATQLTMSRNAPTVLRYCEFESNQLNASNVKATTGAPVTMVNWGGTHGGEAFDDDPNGVVAWPPPTTTTLQNFAATPGPQRVDVSFETLLEVDVERFLLQLETSPGVFATIREFFPFGFGSYVHLDVSLIPGVARTYRLAERLTHGAVRYLAQATAVPWSAAVPASIKRVSPAGPYYDVQSALASATGPTVTVRVAAGTYPAFTIGSAAPMEIEIAPDGTGPVTFDASTAPLVISSRPWNSSVLVTGVTIAAGSSSSPAVVVQYNPFAVVVLDALTIVGSGSAPGVRCEASSVVALQDCDVVGAPGLEILSGSDVVMGRGSLDEGSLTGGSRLRSMEMTAPIVVEPFSLHQAFPGVMPRVAVPRFVSLLEPFEILLEGPPGATWIGGVSAGLRHFDISPEPFAMSELIDLYAILFLVDGGFDPFGEDDRAMNLPADPSLIGKTFHMQVVAVAPGSYAWSNVATLVAVP